VVHAKEETPALVAAGLLVAMVPRPTKASIWAQAWVEAEIAAWGHEEAVAWVVEVAEGLMDRAVARPRTATGKVHAAVLAAVASLALHPFDRLSASFSRTTDKARRS
jgi:hypothetical protein